MKYDTRHIAPDLRVVMGHYKIVFLDLYLWWPGRYN